MCVCVCVRTGVCKKVVGVQMSRPVVMAILGISPENNSSCSNSSIGSFKSRGGGGRSSGNSKGSYSGNRITCYHICVTF